MHRTLTTHQKYRRLTSIFLGVCIVWCALSVADISHAATLSLSPVTTSISSGNIVSVKVLVSTEGQSINTVAGNIQFPTDLLQVMSVSKSSSIFSLWVQDPSFSNSAGTINFTGGVPNPGFTGEAGEIVSIVFKAKKQGSASVIFTDSSVLLNDGLGTNVLTATRPSTITISSSAGLEVPVINTDANSIPVRPVITSSTHPDQSRWYRTNTATFSWIIPSGVTSIQTLLSKNATAIPTVTYDSSVSQRTVNSIADGVLYFQARYINPIGTGPTATYKIQIDTTPPEKFVANVSTEDVKNLVTLKATDVTSGVDSYSIQIDTDPVINVQKDSLVNDQFTLPPRNQGNHNLEVIAYDKAGNHTEAYSTYTSPAVPAPTIEVSPATVERTESVTVKGQTQYPDTVLNVDVQSEGSEVKIYSTKTHADGSYSFQTDPLDVAGAATVWSQLVFSNNSLGPVSDKVKVNVKDSLIVQTSKSIIYGLPFILFAIGLITGMIFMLYYGWHKFFGLKRRIQKETQSVVNETHKALEMFKDELNSQLNKLEKIKDDRELNKKEEKIFKGLQSNIDTIEDFIENRIKKIR